MPALSPNWSSIYGAPNPASTTPRYNPVIPSSISSVVPGSEQGMATASNTINTMLQGMPSTSMARRANAYFGQQSGMPGSDFVRNRGFDLYGQQADQYKQQGFQNLMALMGQGSNAELQRLALAQREAQFAQQQQQQNQQFLAELGLGQQNAASTWRNALGNTWNLENVIGGNRGMRYGNPYGAAGRT